jgi:hypothetical protein
MDKYAGKIVKASKFYSLRSLHLKPRAYMKNYEVYFSR